MRETKAKQGIRRLIENYVSQFRIAENLNYYSVEDFEKAERRFVKFCLSKGRKYEYKGS